MIEILLGALALYLALGVLFALVFHLAGLEAVDPGVKGAGIFFRLLITPGLVGLWPLMAAKWMRARSGENTFGSTEKPVSSGGLRTFHRRLTGLLVLLLPLAVIAAVGWKPAPASIQPAVLKEPSTSLQTPQTPQTPLASQARSRTLAAAQAVFGDTVLTARLVGAGENGNGRRLEVDVPEDLLVPGALLYWGQDETATPANAVLLGAVGNPGTHRFPLPAGTDGGTALLYSTGHGETVAAFQVER